MTYSKSDTDNLVKPIFDELVRQNVDDSVFINLFTKLNKAEYFSYLPEKLQKQEDFHKYLMKNFMFLYKKLPDQVTNYQYISRETYIEMIKSGHLSLEKNIYPQDLEIALAAAQSHRFSIDYKFLTDEFKSNKDVFIEACKQKFDVFTWTEFSDMSCLKQDFDIMLYIISHNERYYDLLSFKEKISTQYLEPLINLGSPAHFNAVKHYLKYNKDPELILLVLSLNNDYYPYLSKYYEKMIDENNASNHAYDFMSSYFLSNKLNKTLNIQTNNSKKNKL